MKIGLRYANSRDDAHILLNAAFLKILLGLKKYRFEKPFEPWIKRIMINTIIDDHRKSKSQDKKLPMTLVDEFEQTNNAVDLNLVEEQMYGEELQLMMQQLPPMTQKVFNLHVIDGYRHQEIAEMLQISKGTSKWHLSNARKMLIELLKNSVQRIKMLVI